MRTRKAGKMGMYMSASTVYRISFTLAAVDLTLATICAANGDAHFVAFMVLAGLMWAHGMYFKMKADKETGE
jgi:hypothetical protein